MIRDILRKIKDYFDLNKRVTTKDDVLVYMDEIERRSREKCPNARIESHWELREGHLMEVRAFIYDKENEK
jgi:hypothetical protein